MKRSCFAPATALLPSLLLLTSACAGGSGGRETDAATDTDATDGTSAGPDDDTNSAPTTNSDPDGSGTTNPTTDPSDGSDGTGTGPGDDDALLELVTSLCDWEFQCCSEGEIDYRLGPFTVDAADCTARFVEQIESNDNDQVSPRADLLSVLGYSIDLGRSDPNAENVRACAEQQRSRPCNALVEQEACESGKDPSVDPCRLDNLFTGTLVAGQPCSAGLAGLADIECGPGSTCEELPSGDWECVDKGMLEEFCEADSTCDGGLFCNIETGRCTAKGGLGEPCAFADSAEPDAGTETLPCQDTLSCDPSSNTCVAFCSQGYDCADDASCPQGQSCIPTDLGDNTYTYCAPRGDTNADRCDTPRDCGEGFHCDGSACTSDLPADQACDTTQECEAGLYCAGVCQVVKNAGEVCAADIECNPSTTLGCITSDDGRLCRTSELATADVCVPGEREGGNWCETGICEDLAADESPQPVCHAGAPRAAACDDDPSTRDILQCALPLYCDDGICKPKVDSGQDCSDDQAVQCLNGACEDIWEGEYCSDAASSIDEGAVTCDG